MADEFDFEKADTGTDGLAAWRRQREEQLSALARANGLPLGKPCRVELCGVVLEGILRLAEDELFIAEPTRDLNLTLQIGRRRFSPRGIISAVRLD